MEKNSQTLTRDIEQLPFFFQARQELGLKLPGV